MVVTRSKCCHDRGTGPIEIGGIRPTARNHHPPVDRRGEQLSQFEIGFHS